MNKLFNPKFVLLTSIFITPSDVCAAQSVGDRSKEVRLSDECPFEIALAGDTKASMRCVERYLKEPKSRRYWEQIAAENGDPIAQYNLGMVMMLEENMLERKRAMYWLKKSADQGNVRASAILKEMEK